LGSRDDLLERVEEAVSVLVSHRIVQRHWQGARFGEPLRLPSNRTQEVAGRERCPRKSLNVKSGL